MLFTLKKVIGNMLLPLPLMLLIIGAGLALLWFSRFQKTGKIFISIGWLALLLLSLQPVADRLLRPIESTYPTWNNSQKVDYIVVLGGGYTWNPQWAPSSNLINNSLPRLNEGIRLWRENPGSKLIFTGGVAKNQYGEYSGSRCQSCAIAGRAARANYHSGFAKRYRRRSCGSKTGDW
ncbi:inner membrane protein [Escherichia coli]|nr:inner membrane protein [Escherichia coli]